MNLNFENYFVSFDNYNATLYKKYIGKTKDENGVEKEVEKQKFLGHYNPNIFHSGHQIVAAIIKNGVSSEGEVSLQEFQQFLDVKEEDVKKWVKEQIESSKV